MPQLQDRPDGHSTTLPSISSRAKQAFIAALAARLRRRAAQRLSKAEGNCSPPSWSRRLDTRQKTLFPRSTVEAPGEVQAAPPFHRASSSAPSFPVLLGACLEPSLRPPWVAGKVDSSPVWAGDPVFLGLEVPTVYGRLCKSSGRSP